MSRIVRLSLALLFALMMVIATASGALAFDPPESDNAPAGSAAATMTGVGGFPAVVQGNDPANAGPWHATACGPNKSPASGGEGGPLDGANASGKFGPINFAEGIPPADCPPPPPPP